MGRCPDPVHKLEDRFCFPGSVLGVDAGSALAIHTMLRLPWTEEASLLTTSVYERWLAAAASFLSFFFSRMDVLWSMSF